MLTTMTARHFIISCMALLACATNQAAQVNENVARNVASQFMQRRGMGAIDATKTLKAPRAKANAATQDDIAYYVFNTKNSQGYVIVSGDSRTRQVLGYNDHGNFDPRQVPEAVQCWLDQYTAELDMLDQGAVNNARESSPKAGVPAVTPFIKTHWGQDNPFNFDCPKLGGKYCRTGSLATAIAQVLYYIYYNSNGYIQFEVSPYTTSTHHINLPLYSKRIEWNDVQTDYTTQTDNPYLPQNLAVARLIRLCAQKLKTDFDTAYSAAAPYSEALPLLYGARLIYKNDYNNAEWENFILAELQAKRPVIYTASNYEGKNHSFVCDGYDGNGYYHFNWGLAGEYDGYFLLSMLQQDAAISDYAPTTGYTISQRIITGLKRGTDEHKSVAFASSVSVGQKTYTRNSSSEYFKINITATQQCNPFASKTYDMGWGVYQEDGYSVITRYTNSVTDSTVAANGYVTYRRNLMFGKNYTDGVYYLRPICRESASEVWYPSHHSGYNRWIRAEIQGNTITLTTPPGTYDSPQGVQVSISSVSDIKMVYRPIELTIKVVNDGYYGDNIPIYLYDAYYGEDHFLKGTQLIGGTQVKVPIGTSAFTKMVFVPQESGSHRIILAKSGGNLNINDDLDRRRIYFEKSINVERSTGSDVSAILEAAEADENDVVLGNDFRIKAELKENRGTTFYDYILIRLFDKKNQIVKELQDVVSIPANGRTTSYFTFENLDPGMYRARAYSYWTSGGFRLIGTSKDYLVGDIKGDVNGDGSVNVTDVTALVNMILGVIPKDTARGDIDGNGTVNVSDVTALVNIILGIN